MKDITILIPAYNEEGILEKTIKSILKKVTVKNYEILICNDNSTDNTLKIAKKLAKNPKIRVISNTGKRGFGNVVLFGIKNAKGKFVVPMMADLCDDPITVNKMYEKTKMGYDVIVGSRYIKGGKKLNVRHHFKSFCSWAIGWIGYYIMKINTHDTANAFKMMRKDCVIKAKPHSDTFDISFELTVKLNRLGCKFTEVPTIWIDREEGESKFKIMKEARRYIRWIMD